MTTTVRLLSSYKGFSPQDIIDLPDAEALNLTTQGNATTDLTGGTRRYKSVPSRSLEAVKIPVGLMTVGQNETGNVFVPEGYMAVFTGSSDAVGTITRNGVAEGNISPGGSVIAGTYVGNQTLVVSVTSGTVTISNRSGASGSTKSAKVHGSGNVGTRIHTGRGGVIDNTTRKTHRAIFELQGDNITVGRPLFCSSYNSFPDPVAGIAANSLAISNAGVGYTNGTYPLTAAGSGGLGSGFTGTVTIAGGVVTAVALTTKGSGYPAPAAGGVTFSFTGAGTPVTPAVITGSTQYTIGTTTLGACSVRVVSDFDAAVANPAALSTAGAPTAIAGAPATAVLAPATVVVSAAGRRTYVAGNWTDLNLQARTDGRKGTTVAIDVYVATNTWVGCMGDGATDDYTGWKTRATRRAAFQHGVGDCVTTPGNFTDATLRSQSVIVGFQYVSNGRVISVLGTGDSITEGRTATLVGEGFGAGACDIAQALTGIDFEWADIGWSGTSSGAFSGYLRDLAAPSTFTGINSNTPGGVVPDILVYPNATPNDYAADGTNTGGVPNFTITPAEILKNRRGLQNIERTRRELRIPGVVWTTLPVNDTVKYYGASDALRRAYNAEFTGPSYKGDAAVADFSTALSGVTNGAGQVQILAGKTIDGIHPEATGNAILAAVLGPQLALLV